MSNCTMPKKGNMLDRLVVLAGSPGTMTFLNLTLDCHGRQGFRSQTRTTIQLKKSIIHDLNRKRERERERKLFRHIPRMMTANAGSLLCFVPDRHDSAGLGLDCAGLGGAVNLHVVNAGMSDRAIGGQRDWK